MLNLSGKRHFACKISTFGLGRVLLLGKCDLKMTFRVRDYVEYVGLGPIYGPTFSIILGKLWFDEKIVKRSLSGYLFSGVTE